MGSLHWFVPRENLRLLTPEESMSTYIFGTKTIKHHFCPKCGIHPFGEGVTPSGSYRAAINVRCLEGVDLSALAVKQFDGRSL